MMGDERDESEGLGHRPPPAIRSLNTQNILRVVDAFEESKREAFYRDPRSSTVDEVRRRFPSSWTPLTQHMALCEVLAEIVGAEQLTPIFRTTFREAVKAPLLRGVFGMFTRMSNDPVLMVLRNSKRLYGVMTRRAGDLIYADAGSRVALLTLRGFPSDEFDFDLWIHGLLGAILGSIDGVRGDQSVTVERERRDLDAGLASYRVRF